VAQRSTVLKPLKKALTNPWMFHSVCVQTKKKPASVDSTLTGGGTTDMVVSIACTV
jgi:hypothetical protein